MKSQIKNRTIITKERIRIIKIKMPDGHGYHSGEA